MILSNTCAFCGGSVPAYNVIVIDERRESLTFHDILCLSGYARRKTEGEGARGSRREVFRLLLGAYRTSSEEEAAHIRERIERELDRIDEEERAGEEGR